MRRRASSHGPTSCSARPQARVKASTKRSRGSEVRPRVVAMVLAGRESAYVPALASSSRYVSPDQVRNSRSAARYSARVRSCPGWGAREGSGCAGCRPGKPSSSWITPPAWRHRRKPATMKSALFAGVPWAFHGRSEQVSPVPNVRERRSALSGPHCGTHSRSQSPQPLGGGAGHGGGRATPGARRAGPGPGTGTGRGRRGGSPRRLRPRRRGERRQGPRTGAGPGRPRDAPGAAARMPAVRLVRGPHGPSARGRVKAWRTSISVKPARS